MSLCEYLCAMPPELVYRLIGCAVLCFSAWIAIKAYLEDRRNNVNSTF